MDEKTEELRDLFVSVTDEETVTETQAETPGSLVDDEGDVAEQLHELITRLRETESFETDLEVEIYAAMVRAFYDGASDAEIAAETGLDPETAFAARLDLHLLRNGDTDAPFDLTALRRRSDADDAELAADLGVDRHTVRRYRRVVEAEDAARRVNYRYQWAFDDLLTDAELARRFTDTQEDGLEEAAEDIETDVSF
ncbi:conditioned medium-induced protein 4 [Halobacteriales archaeon QH_3_68_24]|nr:MAG: conditioned medium-induced protein 4 [Halobacteriales archaeon QH_3_68_24]